MSIQQLTEMSNSYGANPDFVLAGGGNTSYKENGIMYVKGSGAALADIKPEQFVAMDIGMLHDMLGKNYPAELSDEGREEYALADMMAARLPGEEKKRPSVEAILHAMFPQRFVLHVHPALVNGLTCGMRGEELCGKLFGGKAAWIGLAKPGYILAKTCRRIFRVYKKQTERQPQIVLLQNHGLFVAGETIGEIDGLVEYVTARIRDFIAVEPDFSEVGFDKDLVCSIAPALRMLYSSEGKAAALFCVNVQVSGFVANRDNFSPLMKPFTPDHIVYCKDEPLFIEPDEDLEAAFSGYTARKGCRPKIVAVEGLGFFALGNGKKEAENARLLFLDAVRIAVYAESFGGPNPMTDELTEFIRNWEAESYRVGQGFIPAANRCLNGKIALITGSAQGFGKGIAEAMAGQGAYVAVADLNYGGAVECAAEINERYGRNRAFAVEADVTDEESVKRMLRETVLAFGGLDVLVSNAGVLVAGGLADMTKKSFDLVTSVNYTGYFLCAKYASEVMKIQNRYAPGYLTDIIEINSKSGLEGSNRNFAYAGSKFGGIGLTQSFAMELVEYGIKVNAVCPGNFLDGPLWADPEKGLFRQYLDSGKVPGAKTVADVRRFYEAKVPMKRGCAVADVMKAIFYVIGQGYETGQAVPVTGGQVMLR